MNLTNFEQTGLYEVNEFLYKLDSSKIITTDELRYILKMCNVSFTLEGIDRAQSTKLCELGDSYVQQSQRYVVMGRDQYNIPQQLSDSDKKMAVDIIDKALALYDRMTPLIDPNKKGRKTAADYKYSIPIEDGRYILPLAMKTNIAVTLTGDKLVDLFLLFNGKYKYVMMDIHELVEEMLPYYIVKALNSLKINNDILECFKNLHIISKLDKVNESIEIIDHFNNLDVNVGLAAVTSTMSKPPSEVLEGWGEAADTKAIAIEKNVLSYGHSGIAERARTVFAMMCSLVTYHQQIRHRLPNIEAQELIELVYKPNNSYIIPDSIRHSEFFDEYCIMVQIIRDFRNYIIRNYNYDAALPFLINCEQIKLMISTNARMDCQMLKERTCMTAQWEIREISTNKLRILQELSGVLYESAMPPCVTGGCKEGAMTCGKSAQVREKFKRENFVQLKKGE